MEITSPLRFPFRYSFYHWKDREVFGNGGRRIHSGKLRPKENPGIKILIEK